MDSSILYAAILHMFSSLYKIKQNQWMAGPYGKISALQIRPVFLKLWIGTQFWVGLTELPLKNEW